MNISTFNKRRLGFFSVLILSHSLNAGIHYFTVRGEQTLLDNNPLLIIGIRCSNALISEETALELIQNLDVFKSYGINSFSVYFMGSRFGDVKGYQKDGSLNPVYAERMGRIIEAADLRSMVVLVGCLYWGNSKGKWEEWTQREADAAVANTIRWLKKNDYRNVFVDVDNEGMAQRAKNFDNRQMVLAGKAVDSTFIIATNFKGTPPPEADLAIHHSNYAPGRPYIDTEATPSNAPGKYWGSYSKRDTIYNYINIGIYSPEMKLNQIEDTKHFLDNRQGYMMASTWLQCVAPFGPNHRPGGNGTSQDPGIRWWLEFIKKEYSGSPHNSNYPKSGQE